MCDRRMSEQPLTAADLVAHPERIANVEAADVPALLTQLATVTALLATRLPATDGRAIENTETADRLVSVSEAAAMLDVSEDFLYRSDTARPFRVRIGAHVRFSFLKVQAFIRQRAGRT